ncbi:S-layer homology domain-containing protein [Halothermothrix orenii]|uniref:S-layer domain protein n=1 Tax=Halothermothrix orenii (strain H 168 / OCM 544 / DSM 9562) TaxID=373903 RepID=B8CXA8_HALOH|nr:S-layer homology domain-containing protein [Halothermothrix orenii]ACL69927.1 S-layer domain protein [Halothermothrix orenii H 168]
MKKIIVPCLIVLMLFSGLTVSAADLKDVPEDHWAYQSIKMLIDKGYLSLYEDGTFRGKDSVTRYEIAALIGRLLEDIQQGKLSMSEEDINQVKRLSLEFRDDLVELAKKQEIFSDQIERLKEDDLIQNEDIGKVNEKISDLQNDITQIIDSIVKIATLEKKVEKINSRIEELEVELNNQDQEMLQIKKDLGESLYQNLKDQQSINMTKIQSLQGEVNNLKEELAKSQAEIKQLRNENSNYRLYLIGVALLALLAR